MNELFGPVLSVMRAESLEHAIELVNETGYGLTSGLESLDEREQELWKNTLRAGNLYINRPTTGAIVLRQPFGGMGKSSIGSGRKAGGFNYVAQFMDLTLSNPPDNESSHHPFIERLTPLLRKKSFTDEVRKAIGTLSHFAYWLEKEFSREHDYCQIRGESNIIRYVHVQSVLLRFGPNDTLDEMIASIAAVKMAGAKLTVSIPSGSYTPELSWLVANRSSFLDAEDLFVIEDEAQLLRTIDRSERIRFLRAENITQTFYQKVADRARYIASEPFIAHGRIELMHYFIEQSISYSYHRYGNLGLRGLKREGE
jgi:RHH-type proline utilization regulon transcriptional repressor/proline dehydrogenase/delta 1-pyrroline-5-carboxylate dehydrogenase